MSTRQRNLSGDAAGFRPCQQALPRCLPLTLPALAQRSDPLMRTQPALFASRCLAREHPRRYFERFTLTNAMLLALCASKDALGTKRHEICRFVENAKRENAVPRFSLSAEQRPLLLADIKR